MTHRSNRDAQYVIVRDSKSQKPVQYYYDADDDDDPQAVLTTRRIVQQKPVKEQRIRYVSTDEVEPGYRRTRLPQSTHRTTQVHNSNTGERFILDENDNIIKIIRNHRSRTPPLPETRQYRIRQREPRTLYYETADGHLVPRTSKNPADANTKNDFVYAEDEPIKVIRRVVVNPRTGQQETIYEKQKPKKPVQQKFIIRKPSNEMIAHSDSEQQQQQPQYVQVVQRQVVPKQEQSPNKYVIIRKKVESDPVYTLASSDMPTTKTTRRMVYQTAPKKTPMTYVYTANGKYYK